MNPGQASPRWHAGVLVVVIAILAWSGWMPKDRFTWLLEIAPVPIAGALIAFAYPRWRFTPLVLSLIAIHAAILMVGGKYTYAEVPLFNHLRDEFGLARNYYDRVGHFAQGFVPAMVAREILLRHAVVKSRGWLFFVITCICLAVSAFYELVEWWVAVASAPRPRPSSAPRATSGTRNGTCSSPSAARSRRSFSLPDGMMDRCVPGKAPLRAATYLHPFPDIRK
jgi:putative membrane protein